MYKLIIVFILFNSYSLFSQEEIEVSLCNDSVNIVNYEELVDCHKLIPNDMEWKVSSFNMSFSTPSVTLKLNSQSGNFNDKMMELIKKYKPQKIKLSKITIMNSKQETYICPSLVLNIKTKSK